MRYNTGEGDDVDRDTHADSGDGDADDDIRNDCNTENHDADFVDDGCDADFANNCYLYSAIKKKMGIATINRRRRLILWPKTSDTGGGGDM